MKKIFLLFILFVLFVPIMFVTAEIKSGEFNIKNSVTNNNIIDNYYYSDNYFDKSSYIKNDHLRTFSLALIISSDQISLMKEIGLSNIKTYEDEKNEINTIGTTIGYKKIDNYNLIIVSIKNGKKEEWASNFLLGDSGNAKGFDEASKLAINRIKEYIKENHLQNNKILISGYSRAGGVSNLVGIYINEHLDEFETKNTNLFVYTFEAPNSSNSKKVYKNIHNIVNYNDLVTYVYPKGLGLNLNGVIEDISTPDKKIVSRYYETNINDGKEVNQKHFLKEFFSFLSDNVTREEYVSVESDISDLVLLYITIEEEEKDAITSFFTTVINNYLYDENGDINAINGLNLLTLLNSQNEKEALEPLKKIKDYLNTYEENSNYLDIEEKFINIYLVFQKAVYKDFNKKINRKVYPLYYLLTFIKNLEILVSDHYSDTIWVSVKSNDSYYTLGPGIEKNDNYLTGMIGVFGLIILIVISTVFFVKLNNKKNK